jgi:hypothetical protein
MVPPFVLRKKSGLHILAFDKTAEQPANLKRNRKAVDNTILPASLRSGLFSYFYFE